MKLRLHNNSIRFRLTQGEVARLRAGERLEETIRFGSQPGQQLQYMLEPAAGIPEIGAHIENGNIRVRLPEADIRTWADGAEAGMEGRQASGTESRLRILIEKDFTCLHPADPGENTDTFPNPEAPS